MVDESPGTDRQPSVSVLIPVYNMGSFLGSAVESVLRQDSTHVEVIIVDDGSTDDSAAVAASFSDPLGARFDPRVRLIVQANLGKAAALNQALGAAAGRFVMILDADDEMPRGSLGLLYNAVRQENADVIAVGEMAVVEGERVSRRPLPITADCKRLIRQFEFGFRTPFHPNAAIFPSALARRVGGFDPALRRVQDQEFMLRVLRQVEAVRLVPHVVYRYRKHRTARHQRIRLRLATARCRIMMHRKNLQGLNRVIAFTLGIVGDLLKMSREVFGNLR